jgi:Glyoxalase-like domain
MHGEPNHRLGHRLLRGPRWTQTNEEPRPPRPDPKDGDQDAELARLRSLGARPFDIGQGDVTWHVLADPEGNEFCLLRRRV